ncbi:hypothetical protein [Leuconostoc pseudomesenteroides]|uniref:hypothetical protein n=1 Tax=Leuconostoc pseudomesenteroides TaxID=33968 RepID=UPI00345E164E
MNQIQKLFKQDKIWAHLKLLSSDQLGIGMMSLKQPLIGNRNNKTLCDTLIAIIARW